MRTITAAIKHPQKRMFEIDKEIPVKKRYKISCLKMAEAQKGSHKGSILSDLKSVTKMKVEPTLA